jgi:hypothetical protein
VLPGALLAAVISEVGKAAYLVYLDRVANLEAIFGSLSSIVVLLLWLYLSAPNAVSNLGLGEPKASALVVDGLCRCLIICPGRPARYSVATGSQTALQGPGVTAISGLRDP